ncbi:MAG: UvrD-helicase domain-containing protein [Candidatus Nomurabacteria bacterium]|nr:UvrD-helicase domain-containing protein [Candidatus Nomurabacteria bacterium]USN87453.1 MAG: UvrD-helicase domain-containing protein [Candidatus Nomurabacteria bacterium]
MSDQPYLEGLNSAQRQAVLATEGPLLVLAGAGSGKTRVITHRIVHLLHQGVAPYNILAVTFTNKAAKEMRERVEVLIKKYPPSERAVIDALPTVATFHSLGVRILRQYHETLNLRRHFTIYDRSDSLRTVKAALERGGYNPKEFEPKKILSKISRAKGDAKTISELRESAKSLPDQVAATVWGHYEDILKQEHALDFDDLLTKTLSLLQNYPKVREELQNKYKYIHIDEYQDTNAVQFSIAKQLAGEVKNICVVGDIDQNIYSWRGADIKNVLQFEREFAGAKTILLEENYRSTKTIIAASNDVIEKNKNRVPKSVFTSNDHGEKITLYAAMTGIDEAEYIAMTAQSLIEEGVSPAEIAVLYRTNFQSRALEEAFLNCAVPYQLLGTKFYERKEVKDVLSYLRLALNPGSTADLARVINEPTRGIGKVTMLKVIEGRRSELTGATLEKVSRFDQLMSDIADEARTKPLSETLKFIIKRTGIEADLKKKGTEDDLSRLENLQELVTLGQRYDELGPEEAVEQLLETASLQSDQDELKDKDEHDAVRLMTVHAAKGLEFSYVFIAGLEEGLFPHERLDDAGIDHEEERRLFYVALTRASKKLYLTYAHMRTIYGSQRVNIPSSFLNDISTEHVESGNPNGYGDSSGYETTIFLD